MVSFVATPIGNLKDITLRALETLKEADVVFCEDTRHTIKLLNAYEIKKPLYACHKFNETEAAEKILAASRRGGLLLRMRLQQRLKRLWRLLLWMLPQSQKLRL